MTDTENQESPATFQMWPLIHMSWRTTNGQPGQIFWIAGFLFFVVQLIGYVAGVSTDYLARESTPGMGALIAVGIAWNLSMALISAAWIRFVAFGETFDGIMAPVDKRSLRFMGYTLLGLVVIALIGVLFFFPMMVSKAFWAEHRNLSLVAIAWVFGGLTVVCLLSIRTMFFWMDLMKSDEAFAPMESLLSSWHATQGKVWKLSTGAAIVVLPYILVSFVITVVFAIIHRVSPLGPIGNALPYAIGNIFTLLYTLGIWTFMALAYQVLGGDTRPLPRREPSSASPSSASPSTPAPSARTGGIPGGGFGKRSPGASD